MGKAQSKRSVDITTDPKKDGIIEEGTGEMKKIEDVDQLKPQINGDTNHNENEVEKDKVADTTCETENEKDLSTEKEQLTIDNKAQGEGAGDATIGANVTATENGDGELLDDTKGGGVTEQADTSTTTAETPDSSKKPKKEKVKKKWSFRSISFGKKDKQKPSKKDDANTSAVNGECEKVPEETTEEPTAEKKDETTVAATTVTATETSSTEEITESAAATASPTTESPKEVTVTTANAVTVEKPIDTTVGAGGDIASVITAAADIPITNGTTTPPSQNSETKIEEITESLAAVKINDKIDETIVVTAVPDAQHKIDDNITLPATVDEAITTNGDKHNNDDDIKTNGDVVDLTVTTEPVIVSSPKLNGSIESPKIEVKEDIIESNTTNNAVIVNNNNNSSINENMAQNNKNIIEPSLISNSQPPPLPCSPPPSQVMVFALSEIKTNEQQNNNKTDQQQQQQQQLNENDNKIDNQLSTVYEKLATTIEECISEPESHIPEEILHKVENLIEIEQKTPIELQETIQKLPEKQQIIEEENLKNLESLNKNIIEEIDVEQHPTQIPDEELTKNELIISNTVDIQKSNDNDDLPKQQLNDIDLITIPQINNNKIDEIQNILSVVQEIDIPQHILQLTNIESTKNEIIIPEINDIENDKMITDDSNNELTLSITDSQSISNETDNDLPTPPPSPIQHYSNDDDNNVILNDLDKMSGNSNILLITNEQGIQVTDGDVKIESEQQQQQQIKQKQQQPQQQQQKKNKENGVEENHADTLATENLNGVEHKTIEEIKAENQQIEKILPAAEVTQEAATVAE